MDATQFRNLENLCTLLYESSNESERNQAQQYVLVLQSSVEYIPQCQYVLDNSSSPYALVVASTSLTKLITAHWNNFSSSQRVDIRNYVLAYLAQKGPSLEKFVTTSLIQLVCRITKLGWFDDSQHREIVDEVTKFLQATVDHCIIGLQILNELVTDMNLPVAGKNLTFHRKLAVSFREEALFRIFQVSLTTLEQLHLQNIGGASADQERRMGEQAVGLVINCLTFDFIGTNSDECTGETGSVQLPSSWRSLIQDPQTLQLFFDYYNSTTPPIASKCLEVLMLLASVRRSIFSEKDRAIFLSRLLTGICQILSTQQGLSEQENYHEFCRLLSRIKSNFQLAELLKCDSFQEWIERTPDFTVKSFQQWQWSANSTHSLLLLWTHLVAASPYMRLDNNPGSLNSASSFLDVSVPKVIEAYVQSRLDSAQQCSADSSLENPIDDEGGLLEQLEKIHTICHYDYASTGKYLIARFDVVLNGYVELTRSVDQSLSDTKPNNLEGMENQLAWLIYIIGSIIGVQAYAPNSTEGDELIDADLSQSVFRAMQITESRLISTGGQHKASQHFELSLLYYFSNFRRSYIGEQHGMPSVAAPLLLPTCAVVIGPDATSTNSKNATYQRMFEHMGFGDHTVVVNMIVTKIGNNLKFWGNNEVIVSKTMDLFFEIASGYSSGKLLLGLETVQYLIGHHTSDEFPFLSNPANTRHRTTFHMAIARLLFTTQFDECSERFERFIEPIEDVLNKLLQTPNFRLPEVREAITGVCRDLRGIVQQTFNRRTYACIFDMLYPMYFPIFVRAAKDLFDAPAVTNALLKFLQELAHNKAQRIVFDQGSAKGILLFRELSNVVVAYGRQLLAIQTGKDPYAEKYKGISLCLGVLYRAMGGNYVNFGVFELYNDKCLENAIEVGLQLIFAVPDEDLLTYPKLKSAYFFFLEILFRNQVSSVIALDTTIFSQLLQSLHMGITSQDLSIAAQCATAVDHLASLYYHEMKKKRDTPMKHALIAHVQGNPTMWTSILAALFDVLIYGDAPTQWAVSRPILSVTLCSEDALNSYKQSLASSQPVEKQSLVEHAFTTLFADVAPNLEASNRDKFTQKLGQFRTALRGFLTI
ncbi:unnamed protein product [Albugo candida]|uniref:Importin N-terminal domain-containing protein n=1 Tax=Albugo candida TaxID=65357 RepID=A0A024GTQ4_9STRA|nr:unnamed protein product [Albugo candida]|eukprot:CCI50333.1 unnamed protein product [Albugo candida]